MKYPKITVVTPSYNQGKYLEQTILSVIKQNYSNLEYIIMDGGSSDNSVEIIRKYEKHITYWQSKPDGGQAAAINTGFSKATGDIFCWLNSDDYFIDDTLHKVANHFMMNPACEWVVGNGNLVNKKGKVAETIIPNKLDFNSMLQYHNNPIFQASVFWEKGLYEKVGGLNPSLENAMDFDLWVRFAKVISGEKINDILACALTHSDMKTIKYSYLTYIEVALILAKYNNFERAKQLLKRPMKRIFELDSKLRFITGNPLYRKWRERKEN